MELSDLTRTITRLPVKYGLVVVATVEVGAVWAPKTVQVPSAQRLNAPTY